MIAHEYADVFPMATESELQGMAEDIKIKGLIYPIITFDGKILDGRNRARACEIADVTPDYTEYTGNDPLGFVVSLNMERRQLTTSQRAEVARTLKPMYEAISEERLHLAKGQGVKGVANLPQVKSRDQAAAAVGVGGRIVQDAEYVHTHAPELSEKIKAGELTVNAAKQEVKKRESLPKRPAEFKSAEEEEAYYEKRHAIENKQKEVTKKERNPVSDAANYVDYAIAQLERIRKDDPNRYTELDRIAIWAKERKAII